MQLDYRIIQNFIKNNLSLFSDVIYYRNIDSTNVEAFRIADKYNKNFVIIADSQSAGKGRFDREWFSPDCENLYFSLVLKNELPPNNLIMMLTANAVVKTLDKYNIKSFIKWPNDIIVKNKKISGILIEDKFEGNERKFVVIGIGININTDFRKIKTLKRIAISLYQIKKTYISRENFFMDFLQIFEKEFGLLKKTPDKVYNFYLQHIYKLNKKIKYRTEDFRIIKARLSGVDKDGNLILEIRKEIKKFSSGEIILF